MSAQEITIAVIALSLIAMVVSWAIWLCVSDARRWREITESWDARDAELERRMALDRTIWGAQIPPPDVSEP